MLNYKSAILPPPPPSLTFGKLALFCVLLLLPVTVLAEVVTYKSLVDKYNPVWYMGLNDASGSTTAATTGQNTNTATATAVTFQSSGVIGTGAYFNGNTSKIQLAETNHSVWGKQSTVEGWIKASDLYKNLEIVGYHGSSGYCRSIYTDGNGKITFYEWNGAGKYATSSSALQTDEWVYVVGTANASTQKEALYVNGVKVSETSIGTGNVWNSGTIWTIGNKDLVTPLGNSGVSVKGTLDELAVYNTALPQSAILTKYQVATNQVMEKSLMTNATVTASNTYDNRFVASNIKDGVINDLESTDFGKGYWIAENHVTNAYLTVDLGKEYSIDKIDLQNCRNANCADSGTKDFTLYYSTDGSNWTKILSDTLTTASDTTVIPIESFTFDAVNARYVKFEANTYMDTGKSDNRVGLTEMWIFETSKNWQLGTDLSKDWTIDGTKKTGAEFTESNSNTGTVLANHTGTVTLNADAAFNITGNRVLTQSGTVTGSKTLTKTGTGTLELINTIEAGALDIQGGTVSFTTSTTASNIPTITIANGAKALFTNIGVKNSNTDTVITVNKGGTLQFDSDIIDNESYNLIGISSGTKSLTIQGDGTVLKTGSGHQWLADKTGGTTYMALSSKGCIDIQSGCLYSGGWGRYDWSDNYGQLKLSNNGQFCLWDNVSAEVGGLSGDSGTKIFSYSSSTGKFVFGKGIEDANTTYTYNGTIRIVDPQWQNPLTSRTFQKVGAGTQVFTGTIEGIVNFDIQAGTLKLSGNALLGSSTVSIGENGTLELGYTSDTSLPNSISGSGAITKSGSGTLTISNALSVGKTTISEGTLLLNSNGTLGTGAVALNGGTLEIANSPTIKSITGAGKLVIDSGKTTISQSSQIGEVLLKDSTTLHLNSASTIGKLNSSTPITTEPTAEQLTKLATLEADNAITIQEASEFYGVIKADGQTVTINTKSSDVVKLYSPNSLNKSTGNFVASSGRLDMKGYYEGSLEVKGGSTFSPGNSIGTLNMDGTVTIAPNATLLVEMNSTEMDTIEFTSSGSVSFDTGSIVKLVTTDGYTPSLGGDITEQLFTSIPGLENALKNNTTTFSSYYYQVNRNPDGSISIGVNPNAVPEPSTWALLILGTFGLMWLRKRK